MWYVITVIYIPLRHSLMYLIFAHAQTTAQNTVTYHSKMMYSHPLLALTRNTWTHITITQSWMSKMPRRKGSGTVLWIFWVEMGASKLLPVGKSRKRKCPAMLCEDAVLAWSLMVVVWRADAGGEEWRERKVWVENSVLGEMNSLSKGMTMGKFSTSLSQGMIWGFPDLWTDE